MNFPRYGKLKFMFQATNQRFSGMQLYNNCFARRFFNHLKSGRPPCIAISNGPKHCRWAVETFNPHRQRVPSDSVEAQMAGWWFQPKKNPGYLNQSSQVCLEANKYVKPEGSAKSCGSSSIFPIKQVPSSKLTVRPWQIGVGRLVSNKNGLFSGSMLIYQRV